MQFPAICHLYSSLLVSHNFVDSVTLYVLTNNHDTARKHHILIVPHHVITDCMNTPVLRCWPICALRGSEDATGPVALRHCAASGQHTSGDLCSQCCQGTGGECSGCWDVFCGSATGGCTFVQPHSGLPFLKFSVIG